MSGYALRLPVALGLVTAAVITATTATGAAPRPPADRQIELADRLSGALGGRAAGTYLDPSGRLVVNVLDAPAADLVRAAGATPRAVVRSLPALEGLRDLLGRVIAGLAPTGSSWYVDVVSDSVVLRVPGGGSAALRQVVAALGPAVRVEPAPGAVATQALDGGSQLETSTGLLCSLGFNAVDRTGRPVLITAGHCAGGEPSFNRYGLLVGTTRGSSFPGHDYAYVGVEDPDFWRPSGAVGRWDGTAAPVRGSAVAPVGATVCKSGRTTGWTCGVITARDVTVQYAQGPVHGLTRASVCTENGDSGAPLLAGDQAQGTLSGGVAMNGTCLSKHGLEDEAYFQPIGPVLSRYSLRLRLATDR